MKKIFKHIKKHWLILIILLFLVGFGLYRQVSSGKGEGEATYKVKKQNLKETLTFAGNINADEKVTLRFQTSGRLNWVGVKEGQYVKKFQTVATLDQREVKKKLDKELRDYIKERADFDQTQDDYEYSSGNTARRIRDIAQADLDLSVLDVEIQKLSVEFSNLFTPIAGVVTKVSSPFAGVNITPAQAEFEVVNPNSIYFSAVIDQTELVGLEEGSEGILTLDPYPDENINVKIKSISFAPITGESGTVYEAKLFFDVDNLTYKYRLGMTGDVEFVIREVKNIIAVPSEFIHPEDSRQYVLIEDNGAKKKTYVTTGEVIEDFTQIKSGIKEGDVIYD
ncbi:MAG: efflux RND transporter periplasmic adaptor subunit [Patescibacteria group bacterium]